MFVALGKLIQKYNEKNHSHRFRSCSNREANQVMLNIGEILKAAGMDFSNVVKTTIFLTDMGNFTHVNEVYGQFFKSDFPARETVQVSRLPKDVNVEISVIAMR